MELALAGEGHAVRVVVDEDRVELVTTRHVIMLSKVEQELRDLVARIPGVVEVVVTLGPEVCKKDMYRTHQTENRKNISPGG